MVLGVWIRHAHHGMERKWVTAAEYRVGGVLGGFRPRGGLRTRLSGVMERAEVVVLLGCDMLGGLVMDELGEGRCRATV